MVHFQPPATLPIVLPQTCTLLRMSQFVDHVIVSILHSVNLKYET